LSSSSGAKQALLYIAIVVAIILGAELLIGGTFGPSPVYVVVSGSMTPTLKIGDLVVIQSVPYTDIHVGDVIVYVPPSPTGGCAGEDIVHRVVSITPSGLITQGDNRASNPLPDEPYEWPPVTPGCVVGKVVVAIPYLGMLSMAFPPPYNYFLVGLILLFVFVTEFFGGGGEERPSGGASPTPDAPQSRSLTWMSAACS
jgi:signal peptidase I